MPLRPGVLSCVASILASAATAAWAGPPYVTDDPEPTDFGHWEIYNYVTATSTPAGSDGQGGFDINYGAAKNLQLTMVFPVAIENWSQVGPADVQLAAKYKFVHQQDGGWTPDVSFFPRIFVPSGASLDPEKPGLFLPIWAEKDWGDWSLFGGGGLQLNPGAGQRNFWQTGIALSRQIGRLSLGAEVFHITPPDRASTDFTAVDVGATYKLTNHWTLMFSAGPGVQNARVNGQSTFYAALEATY